MAEDLKAAPEETKANKWEEIYAATAGKVNDMIARRGSAIDGFKKKK